MFDFKTILIVDESGYAALDLSEAIEESDGCVAGPVTTLCETLTILDSTPVSGAVVDCGLAAACDVVMLLTERDVPMVVQISASLPHSLGDLRDKAGVVVRPVDPRSVLETLLMEMGRSELRAPNRLACTPKQV